MLPFKWNLSVRIVTKSTGGYSAKFCMVRFSPAPPPKKKNPLQALLTEEEPHLYMFLVPQTSFCREATGGVTCEMSAVFSCYSFRRLTGVCLVLFFQVFGKPHLPWSNEIQGQHRSYYGNLMLICKIATCGCYHDDKIFKGFIQIIFRFDLQIEYSVI